VNLDSYFHDHWVTIEPERFERYDQLFRLPDQLFETMLAPLGLAAGHVCLDVGCGPGYVAAAMARRVGTDGRVHGIDVNADFIERSRVVAAEASQHEICTFHHVTDDRLPLPDDTVDRAIAKNVLEYVPDLGTTLTEIHRVLRPGGRLLALDSDWGFVVVEPLAVDEVRDLFRAAAPAFREPYVGRRLRGAFRAAGFTDVDVTVTAGVDVAGRTRGVLENMLGYGLRFGGLTKDRVDDLRARLDAALEDGSFMVVLPQFVATGTKV